MIAELRLYKNRKKKKEEGCIPGDSYGGPAGDNRMICASQGQLVFLETATVA